MDKADAALRRRNRRLVVIFVALAAALSALIFWWLFFAHISLIAVRGSSMEPYLHNGDNVVLKQSKAPEPGEIFVFRKPASWSYLGTGEHVLIKRIAAVPGDTLTYDGKRFAVNGKTIYNLSKDNYQCSKGQVGYSHRLTPQEVFVLGDNASVSLDSRRIFCDGSPKNAYISNSLAVDFGRVERIF